MGWNGMDRMEMEWEHPMGNGMEWIGMEWIGNSREWNGNGTAGNS